MLFYEINLLQVLLYNLKETPICEALLCLPLQIDHARPDDHLTAFHRR